jgi:hypothetical protein
MSTTHETCTRMLNEYADAQRTIDTTLVSSPEYRFAEAVIFEIAGIFEDHDMIVVGDYTTGYKFVEYHR